MLVKQFSNYWKPEMGKIGADAGASEFFQIDLKSFDVGG
jgi:hypothetical protein